MNRVRKGVALTLAVTLVAAASASCVDAEQRSPVLGKGHTTNTQVQTFPGYCPPPSLGQPAPPCAPPGLRAISTLRLKTRGPGLMRVRGAAKALDAGPEGDACAIFVLVHVDGKRLQHGG